MIKAFFARLGGAVLKPAFAVKFIMSFVGVVGSGAAVGMLKFADFGTDPYNTLMFGIADATGVDYSLVYLVVTVVFLAAVLFLDRRYAGVTTALNFLLAGPAAQATLNMLESSFGANPVARIAALIVGLPAVCVTVSFMIIGDLGQCAYDAFGLIMEKRTPLSYRVCRVITDSCCVAAGFFLGASVGIMTLIAAFCMGPIINWSNVYISRPLFAAFVREPDRDGGDKKPR
jgi:uncharacterized membrane protein YczE